MRLKRMKAVERAGSSINLLFWSVAILLLLFMTACGGGGGGGGGVAPSGPVYTGPETLAVIDPNNAVSLALGSLYGGPVLDTIGPLSVDAGSSQQGGASMDATYVSLGETLFRNLRSQVGGEVSPRPLALLPINQTFGGNCGGNQVLKGNVDNTTGHYSGTLQFNNYCEDGTTMSGQTNVSGAIDLVTQENIWMTISFQSLQMTSGGQSVTVRGTYKLEGPTLMTMNHHIKDNQTGKIYKIVDYLISETTGVDWSEETITSGRYYHPDYGYVNLTTLVPFRIYTGDPGPTSGQLQITGANGSIAVLASLTINSYEVRVDADGDGTFEWTSPPQKWSSINGVPVADAGGNLFVATGSTVQLDGSGSTDPDSDPLTYSWSFQSLPAGSASTLSNPQNVAPSFVPDLTGTYVVSLTVNDGTVDSAAAQVTVSAVDGVGTLGYQVTDAEYSRQLERLVMVSSAPANRLHILDPVLGTDVAVDLSLPPSCVSVSPDGLYAAVGHNGWISYVDLSAGTLVKTMAVSTDVIDIVLAGNGYVYAFPRVDQWETIRCVDIVTETETLSSGLQIRAGTLAKLHPDGISIYGADNGLSPSDIEKYDISAGTAAYLYDSPYHGDFAMCGELWIAEDGQKIFTRCGNAFASTPQQATDMIYSGSLGSWVQSLSHSATVNRVAVIPRSQGLTAGTEDTVVDIYSYDFLTLDATVPLPVMPAGGQGYPIHGKFVFYSSDGSRYFVIAQVDASAGLTNNFVVLNF